jgi:dihydroorotate dehydrogenase electron transfer subunit
LKKIKSGETLRLVGPLGKGFGHTAPINRQSQLLLVGGGVGIPPLLHWAEHLLKTKKVSKARIHIFLGARNKTLLLCENDFKKLGVTLHLATDDGSKGEKGFVTGILRKFLDEKVTPTQIFTCGPTPMLKAVSALAGEYEIPCEVSVEVPMACGFGACLGCAMPVKNGKDTRFAIACVEGPVFRGQDIVW